MNITATHINYYHICHRKLWLFANGINMETTSDTVAEGKLIHETSYPTRSEKYQELEIAGSKIDYYDPENKIVHETKKSDKVENAHIAQVKYYLYLLEKHGVSGPQAILEYPKLRETKEVILEEGDMASITSWLDDIRGIINQKEVPDRIQKSFCKSCSYFDFCWSGEG